MRVDQVLEIAKTFVKREAGYSNATVVSSEPEEAKNQWRITVDVGILFIDRKEVVIDDRDGNVIAYRAIKAA